MLLSINPPEDGSEIPCISTQYYYITKDDQQLAKAYLATYLILNFVIILNLVIAILSTTYE